MNENECCICMEHINHGDNNCVSLNCGHEFHVTCISAWLKEKEECPVCRVCVCTEMDGEKNVPSENDEENNLSPQLTEDNNPRTDNEAISPLLCFRVIGVVSSFNFILLSFLYIYKIEQLIWSFLLLIMMTNSTNYLNKTYRLIMKISGIIVVGCAISDEIMIRNYDLYFTRVLLLSIELCSLFLI